MKGATADSNNMGRGYKSIIQYLGLHSVPEGWVQRPKFNDKGDVPGPPIQWQKPEDPDNAQPGYGYIPTDTTNVEDIFFYHSDHLGSTSYITDAKANITQFDVYLPYGELLVDEHSSSEDMPYKFNGKEFNEETGLYYYGARYMNPVTSLWYGVDLLAEKYPDIGGYIYCHNNPIILADPTGMDDIFDEKGNFIKDTGKGSMVLVQQGGQMNKLSSFDYSEGKDANRNMLINVSSYYLSQSDKNTFNLSIVKPREDDPIDGVIANIQGTNKYVLPILGGKLNKVFDDKYNFLNMTYHESRHRYDKSTWGGIIGEVNAILQQTSHKSWGLVSSDFAASQAGYAAKKLQEAWVNGSLDNSKVENYINKLNDAFVGIATFNYNPTTKFVEREIMIKEVIVTAKAKEKK